jgi:uncharacterized membrane protein
MKGGNFNMKKFAVIASVIGLLGIIFSNAINSASWLNQPKRPSMLVK